MSRALRIYGMAGAALLLLAAVFVALHTGADDLPAPDPSLPIGLPDGSSAPLAEVIERAREGRLPVPPLAPPQAIVREDRAGGSVPEAGGVVDTRPSGSHPWAPVFRLADDHLRRGHLDQALALYQSIPEGHPDFARSRRRIAWDILAKGRGEPGRAIPLVNRALLTEPFNGNSWQDLARVYGRTLGLPVH